MLGDIQHLVDVGARVIATVDDFGGGPDQAAQNRLSLDDLRVIGRVGGRGNVVHQRCQVGRAAYRIQQILVLQRAAERNQVHRLILVRHSLDCGKNFPVSFAVEVIPVQDFLHRVDGAVFQQNAAQDGLFGLDILGRQFV